MHLAGDKQVPRNCHRNVLHMTIPRRIFMPSTGEYEVIVNIHDTEFNGLFPRRALRLVLEWRDLHREELMETGRWCNKEGR